MQHKVASHRGKALQHKVASQRDKVLRHKVASQRDKVLQHKVASHRGKALQRKVAAPPKLQFIMYKYVLYIYIILIPIDIDNYRYRYRCGTNNTTVGEPKNSSLFPAHRNSQGSWLVWCVTPKYLSNYIMYLIASIRIPPKKRITSHAGATGWTLASVRKKGCQVDQTGNMPPPKKKAKELSKPWCDNPILENIIQNLGKPPSPVEGVRLTQVKPCRTYLGILVSTFFFWNMFFFGGNKICKWETLPNTDHNVAKVCCGPTTV